MSGSQSSAPNQSFHDRLNRVAEVRAPIEAEKPVVEVLPDIKETIGGNAGMFVAVLVGIVAVLLVRIGRFHMTGAAMVTDTPDLTMAIEGGAALALSLLVFLMLPYRGAKYGFAQFGGVVLMVSMMHNAVHQAPSLFGAMFSPEWTAQVTAVTEPNSLFLRGETIYFVEPEDPAEEKILPPVRRLTG